MKVAKYNIVTSITVKMDSSQAESKDLAVRGPAAWAILEEITGKTQ